MGCLTLSGLAIPGFVIQWSAWKGSWFVQFAGLGGIEWIGGGDECPSPTVTQKYRYESPESCLVIQNTYRFILIL